MQLITLEEAKKFLGIEENKVDEGTQVEEYTLENNKNSVDVGTQTETAEDMLLKLYIEGVSETILSLIGRDILATDYIEKYAGTDTDALILKHYPINSVKSIKYVLNGEVQKELKEGDYDINAKAGILYRDLAWWQTGGSSLMCGRINYPRRYIKVEYNAGYEEVPADLKLLALELIKQQIEVSSRNGLKSYSISDVRKEWETNVNLNTQQMQIIKKNRGASL